jgi:hypothetical protein
MARSIEVRVDGRGRLVADFQGFLGDDCFDEADRLAKVLASFGLAVRPEDVRPKPAQQQRLEAGLDAGTARSGAGGPLWPSGEGGA